MFNAEGDWELDMAREAGPMAVAELQNRREEERAQAELADATEVDLESEAAKGVVDPDEVEEKPMPWATEVTKTTWWGTEAGRAARSWLMAWGAVHQVRAITGDANALPGHLSEFRGGGRGVVEIPDVLAVHGAVQTYLDTQFAARERELIAFIYVRGLTERARNQALFPDGTRGPIMSDDEWAANPPQVRIALRIREAWREVQYDLTRFKAPEVDLVCRTWTLSKVGFLEGRHRIIAKSLAEDLAL
ncbi:MAG: hypothetical protein ACO1SV_27570 [Fimbriimonas sp.]